MAYGVAESSLERKKKIYVFGYAIDSWGDNV